MSDLRHVVADSQPGVTLRGQPEGCLQTLSTAHLCSALLHRIAVPTRTLHISMHTHNWFVRVKSAGGLAR